MSKSLEPPVCVILAGGLGTRIRSILPDIPKPLAIFEGKPFIEWAIRFLAKQGIREFIISAGYKGEMIADYFTHSKIPKIRIDVVIESTPRGTAGGFLEAYRSIPYSTNKYLIVNSDSLVLTELQHLWKYQKPYTASILAVFQQDASSFGTLEFDEKMNLTQFKEKMPGTGYINAGIYCFSQESISRFSEGATLSFEKDIFPNLIERKEPIKVIKSEAPFLDMGTPDSFAQANSFIKENMNWFLD